MKLRKAKLIPLKGNAKVFKVESFNDDVLCWRNSEICTSNCTAWRIDNNVIMCMALPTDKRVAQIITE